MTSSHRAAVAGLVLITGCVGGRSGNRGQADPAADQAAPLSPIPATATAPNLKRVTIASGSASFFIEAPLVKTKGKSSVVRGSLDIDPNDLRNTKGQVEVDLEGLATETFGDPAQNATQTQHAKEWLEIGGDVDAKIRERNRWARFVIRSIQDASGTKIAALPVVDGGHQLHARALGDLFIHGMSMTKAADVTVIFSGPPEAPSSAHIVTQRPIRASLRDHDVKPRDVAGKVLSGTLESLGQKMDDAVLVAFDVTANATAK